MKFPQGRCNNETETKTPLHLLPPLNYSYVAEMPNYICYLIIQ